MFTAILAGGHGLALVARRIPLTIDRPNLFLATAVVVKSDSFNEIFCLFLQQIVASDDEGEDDAEAAFLASLTEKQKKKLLRFDFICGILLFRLFFLRSLMGGACTILNISTEKNKKKNRTEQNENQEILPMFIAPRILEWNSFYFSRLSNVI